MGIFQLPAEADRQFTSDGVTLGQIYALTESLRSQVRTDQGPVCLATPDRARLTAGLLLALSGGPRMVLPHSLSPQVLAQAHKQTGFGVLLGSGELARPKGVRLIDQGPGEESRPPPTIARAGDDPFVGLFTGGSTGRPRIWQKTPANLMGEADFLRAHFGFGPDDLIASSAPPMHIYGLIFSVLIPLLAGARVIVEPAYLPAELVQLLAHKKPSVFISGPVHYRALRNSPLTAPSLRLAFSSGAMLDEADATHFSEQTGQGVTEIYGSTESGGAATRCRALGQDDWTLLPVVDHRIWEEQLLVRSQFMSPGLPLTREGFFETGDRADASRDGRFILRGRADGIVKVAGKRVDLLEVEQKLRSLDQVSDAHVLAQNDAGPRGSEIIALVVSTLDETQLRRLLVAALEPQAIPRRIVVLDKIPTTQVGKRDKGAIEELLGS